MKTITLKQLEIGSGAPKIIVPVIGKVKPSYLMKSRFYNRLILMC